MAQRNSEYQRMLSDDYATPFWVTEALLLTEKFDDVVWEPACGDGHMWEVLQRHYATDGSGLNTNIDFLQQTERHNSHVRAIITNPPYSLAGKFVRHALQLMQPCNGKVAMLLPQAWDAAKTRSDIFRDHSAFKIKYTLTKRIRWENLEQKAAGPSMNHAWYVWDWTWNGPPMLGWLP